MPCYLTKDGIHVCGNLGPHCTDCQDLARFLCDYPVGKKGKTCDRHMCQDHANEIAPDIHYCAGHKKMWDEFEKSGGVKSRLENVQPFEREWKKWMYKFCSQEMQRRVSQILPKDLSGAVESMTFAQTRECLLGHKDWLDGEIKAIRKNRPRNGIGQIKEIGQKMAEIMLCVSELNARIRAENPIPDDIAFKIAAGKILPQATMDTITGLARTIQKEYQDRAAKDVSKYD